MAISAKYAGTIVEALPTANPNVNLNIIIIVALMDRAQPRVDIKNSIDK